MAAVHHKPRLRRCISYTKCADSPCSVRYLVAVKPPFVSPMEDFYIGGASVKLFLPIFKMNFPEIKDIALRRKASFKTSSR